MSSDGRLRRRRLTRWTAWGFVLGSALFAVGVPVSLDTSWPPWVGAATFFLGSLLFTTAAALQFVLSRDALPQPSNPAASNTWFAWVARPRTMDWTASAVQLAGTLWFNVTTFRGLVDAVGGDVSAAQVWRPDAYGSIAFLVSSGLAFAPEVRRRRHAHVLDRSWVIAALNVVGSIFFAISAVGAWTVPSAGTLLSEMWSNVGTLLGAVCFLAGASLLLPRESTPT
jgi:hypothetical protein